jgi:DNA-binding NarL/FixJ family response regulator
MAMSAEEAAEYALSEDVAHAVERPLAGGETNMPLTRREREVAALVARGLSTRQIAQELVISERTVDKHVANLLKKLNLRSRDHVAGRISEHRAQLPYEGTRRGPFDRSSIFRTPGLVTPIGLVKRTVMLF